MEATGQYWKPVWDVLAERGFELMLVNARHAVNENNRKLARQTLKTHIAKSAEHPLSTALLNDIEAGKTPPLLVTSPNDGLAEVFYGIGDALAGEGGLDMGIIFLQFALYLEPDFPLAQVALAEAYDSAKRYDLELAAFDNINEDSPLWLNVQIQKALGLNSLDRVDDAKALLEKIIAKSPKDIRPLDALGNILRSHERYAEARDILKRGTDISAVVDRKVWRPTLLAWLSSTQAALGSAEDGEWDEALATARSIGNRMGEAGILAKRAETAVTHGDIDAARPDAEAAIALMQEIGLRPMLARTRRAWGESLRAAGKASEAEPHLRDALAGFEELGLTPEADAVRAELSLGETKIAFGEPPGS